MNLLALLEPKSVTRKKKDHLRQVLVGEVPFLRFGFEPIRRLDPHALALYRSATRRWFVDTRDSSLFYAYQEFCRIERRPFIAIESYRRFAHVRIDLNTCCQIPHVDPEDLRRLRGIAEDATARKELPEPARGVFHIPTVPIENAEAVARKLVAEARRIRGKAIPRIAEERNAAAQGDA